MKLSIIRTIRREDLAVGGDPLPAWVDKMIGPLNDFIEQMATALAGRLSIGDNLSQKYITQTFSDGVELSVNPVDKRRVVGMIPVYSADKMITGYKFIYKNNGNIGVTLSFDSAGTSSCKILLLFE